MMRAVRCSAGVGAYRPSRLERCQCGEALRSRFIRLWIIPSPFHSAMWGEAAVRKSPPLDHRSRRIVPGAAQESTRGGIGVYAHISESVARSLNALGSRPRGSSPASPLCRQEYIALACLRP